MVRYLRTTRLQLEALEGRCTPSYAVLDLGVLSPSAINNASVVAGTANGHAAVEANGIITDLGTLGGIASAAKDINSAGQVVGSLQRRVGTTMPSSSPPKIRTATASPTSGSATTI